jgi:hypothetical protein
LGFLQWRAGEFDDIWRRRSEVIMNAQKVDQREKGEEKSSQKDELPLPLPVLTFFQ